MNAIDCGLTTWLMPLKSPRHDSFPPSLPLGCHPFFMTPLKSAMVNERLCVVLRVASGCAISLLSNLQPQRCGRIDGYCGTFQRKMVQSNKGTVRLVTGLRILCRFHGESITDVAAKSRMIQVQLPAPLAVGRKLDSYVRIWSHDGLLNRASLYTAIGWVLVRKMLTPAIRLLVQSVTGTFDLDNTHRPSLTTEVRGFERTSVTRPSNGNFNPTNNN